MQTAFAKYEGAGNDFILIDNREGGFTPRAELIAALCDRHFGIGADGLMTLARNAEIDCSMRYYNADGSEGEMCGNGARCFALFAEHRGIGGETKFFDAADGLHTARIRRLKQLMAAYNAQRDLIAIGAYQRGNDPLVDDALALWPQILQFLGQDVAESADVEASRNALARLLDGEPEIAA